MPDLVESPLRGVDKSATPSLDLDPGACCICENVEFFDSHTYRSYSSVNQNCLGDPLGQCFDQLHMA